MQGYPFPPANTSRVIINKLSVLTKTTMPWPWPCFESRLLNPARALCYNQFITDTFTWSQGHFSCECFVTMNHLFLQSTLYNVLFHKILVIPLREIIDNLFPLWHLNSKISECQTQLLRRKCLSFRTFTFWLTYCIYMSSRWNHRQSEYSKATIVLFCSMYYTPSLPIMAWLIVCHCIFLWCGLK